MKKKRPTAVTVMGILNIIFGSLGLLAMLCLVMCFGIFISMTPDRDMPAGINPFKTMLNYPEIRYYFIVSGVVGLITSTILLIAGIGLLRMGNWARITSIGYSVFTILFQLATLFYNIGYFNPAMERWQRDYLERVAEWQRQRGGIGIPPQQPQNPMMNIGGGIIGAIVGMIYSIVLLIMMLQPHVSAAFTGRGAIDDARDRRDEDYYDEGFERRRREDWSG